MADDMIRWLYDLRHFGVKLGLDNIRGLLRVLDHPERAYASVHVAGTNGKGSVAAMLDAMLFRSGLANGLFTSPHLVRPNERIRIRGEDIETAELNAQLDKLRTVIAKAVDDGRLEVHPSFFEVITGTALESFRDHGLDTAVLEVGLGGRLDATNAVTPAICVITGIDLDHTKTLGPTLESIAGEKAGIIKKDVPVVSGVVQQRAINVIRDVCRDRGAELIDSRLAASLTRDDGERFTLATRDHVYRDLSVGLPGRHQIDNARLAVVTFERLARSLGRDVDPEAVRQGIATVRWPGRLQWIEATKEHPAMLLDAAHNPAGMDALTAFLRRRPSFSPVVLFGATSGKPLERLLEPLAEFSDSVVIATPGVERGIDSDEVATVATRFFDHVETTADAAAALEASVRLAGSERAVLVTGSLYLVGEVLGLLSPEAVPGPIGM